MTRYLLVVHQTAESEELLRGAASAAGEDPDAEFVLLIPATPGRQPAGLRRVRPPMSPAAARPRAGPSSKCAGCAWRRRGPATKIQ